MTMFFAAGRAVRPRAAPADALAPPGISDASISEASISEATPVPSANSDTALLAASIDTPHLFAEIFERHGSAVHRYLSARLGPTDADDLVGETFLRAFESRRKFRDDAESARPWLMGIATNLIRRRQRDEIRRYRAMARVVHHDSTEISPADRVAARVDADSATQALVTALASLSAKDRDVLLLFAWGQLSYAEIAESADVPVGTVRSRLSRARSALRGALPTHLMESFDE